MKSIQHHSRICAGTQMGKELYRAEDDMGFIVVTQRGDKRVLSFASGLEQSSVLMSKPYYLTHEYTQIMLLGLIFVEAKSVTLAGLGGGGLAHCLSHYFPQIPVRAVEVRQAVIDVAYDWFDLPKTPQLTVLCADASEYFNKVESDSTDVIFCDLYQAEGMSEVQQQQGFISACEKALTQQGRLVLNFHHLPAEDSAVMQQLRQLFTEIMLCDVFKGNQVMFCGKSPAAFDKAALNSRARDLVKKVNMPLMYYFKQLRCLKDKTD